MYSPVPEFFPQLEERLLRAGVAPRHVRRYLRELADHFADILAEEQSSADGPDQVRARALARLGSLDHLAQAMLSQPRLRAWSARVPWAVFLLGPLLTLAAIWSVCLLILWSGWRMFLPGAPTPFVSLHGNLAAMVWFAAGRNLWFAAPLLTGWGLTVFAARQRIHPLWPIAGLALVAVAGAFAQVRALSMHVSLAFAPALSSLVTASGILAVAVTPWILWQMLRSRRATE